MNILKNKQILGGAAVLVVCALIYFVWSSGGSTALLTSSADTTSPLSAEILATLSSINSIKLDSGVFKDPVFVSLTDFGVTIPPEAAGRRNPFAPVGTDMGTSTASTTLGR